jgi:DNA-binding transcriptional LysR family regulator
VDIELAKTFLEIVTTRSFIRAAERLHVSQTTVSARIRSLESLLGRPLFVRNKSGATMTPAGEQFLRYAPMFVQLWERARHQVAIPPGRSAVLSIGGELSLWQPWLPDWMHWMRKSAPDVALRVQVGLAEELTNQVTEGMLDIAIMYAPRHRAGARVELLLEEKLVFVTTDMTTDRPDPSTYVYVDWGPDFALHHNLNFPDVANSGLFIGLGPLALNYILAAGGSGYFRQSSVSHHLAQGRLRIVPDTPSFFYPVYAMCSGQADSALIDRALTGLRAVANTERDRPQLSADQDHITSSGNTSG